jgi:hypothetical protein
VTTLRRARSCVLILSLLLGGSTVFVEAQRKSAFTPYERVYYTDPAVVAFVRPGLVIRVASANITSDGTISAITH